MENINQTNDRSDESKTPVFVARPAAQPNFRALLHELGNMITLNLLFLATCIPLITIPAALTAMNRITCSIVQDQNYFLWQDYWRTFRREFGKALLGGLVYGGLTILFIFAGLVYYAIFGKSTIFMVILAFTACMLVTVYMASTYYWTMLAFVDLPFRYLFKNSLIMVFGCWKNTLLAFVLVLAHLFFTVGMAPVTVGKTTILTDIWVFGTVLIGFSLHSLLLNFAIWPPIFERVVKPAERAKKSLATAFGSKEKLTWDTEEELKSASLGDLNWEDEK